jgi:hypothetical protein
MAIEWKHPIGKILITKTFELFKYSKYLNKNINEKILIYKRAIKRAFKFNFYEVVPRITGHNTVARFILT